MSDDTFRISRRLNDIILARAIDNETIGNESFALDAFSPTAKIKHREGSDGHTAEVHRRFGFDIKFGHRQEAKAAKSRRRR